MPQFDSFVEWRDWLSSWHTSLTKKKRAFVITVSSLWVLWRYRNSVIFNSRSMRKEDIFDNIRLYSFSWLRYRGGKINSWIDWLKSPMYP